MTRTIRPVINAQNLKVVAIQGHPVAPVMPGVGDTLVWDGAEWVPTPMPTARVGSNAPRAAGATLNLDTTVVGIQGTPVFPVASFLAPGDALLWTGVDWKNYPVAKSLSASDLGPYLPISAYNPGGGGDFLPLTGGVLSGPGALTVGDILTLEGAASAGGNSLVDMRGGSAVVQADGNGLLLQQLGDQYGLTSLLIANRDGLNGAMFTNDGLDLVDFAFQTSSGTTGTLRLDARSIPTGQFSFMLSGNTLFTVDSAGNAQFFGTTTLAGDAVAPLEAVTLEQLNNAIANVPPPAPPLNGPIIGVTDGSQAAPGQVGEIITHTWTGSVNAIPNGTASGVNAFSVAQFMGGGTGLAIPPGDWQVQIDAVFTASVSLSAWTQCFAVAQMQGFGGVFRYIPGTVTNGMTSTFGGFAITGSLLVPQINTATAIASAWSQFNVYVGGAYSGAINGTITYTGRRMR